MSTNAQAQASARGVLRSIDGDQIVLGLPQTDYEIRLTLIGSPSQWTDKVGKRVRGVIEGRALRVHPAAGGGRFIEPISGEPRIVAGTVLVVDEANQRLLIDVSVPIWLTTEDGQDYGDLRVGGLANCYVQSGTTFTPEAG